LPECESTEILTQTNLIATSLYLATCKVTYLIVTDQSSVKFRCQTCFLSRASEKIIWLDVFIFDGNHSNLIIF